MKQDCYFRLSICGTILISLMLIFLVSGCTAMVPLGREARLGYVAIECRYLPPVAWDRTNRTERTDLRGWRK
jgi:hypothetical protein